MGSIGYVVIGPGGGGRITLIGHSKSHSFAFKLDALSLHEQVGKNGSIAG